MKPIHLPTDLPYLPGNTFTDPYKVQFHKTHLLDKKDGIQTGTFPLAVESVKPMREPVDHELIRTMREGDPARITGVPERVEEGEQEGIPKVAPTWLKHDREALRFYAFFQEPVHESREENFKVRKCVLTFHLEDATIYISEPRIENSGIPQGVFLTRRKVPKPSGGYYEPQDLNIGINLPVYERVFRVVDCDEFTRNYYAGKGIPLNPSEGYPADMYQTSRLLASTKIPPPDNAEIREYTEKKLNGGRPNGGLRQFLENDRKVLTFDIVWNDASYDGGRKFYKLDYFLSDDTVIPCMRG